MIPLGFFYSSASSLHYSYNEIFTHMERSSVPTTSQMIRILAVLGYKKGDCFEYIRVSYTLSSLLFDLTGDSHSHLTQF